MSIFDDILTKGQWDALVESVGGVENIIIINLPENSNFGYIRAAVYDCVHVYDLRRYFEIEYRIFCFSKNPDGSRGEFLESEFVVQNIAKTEVASNNSMVMPDWSFAEPDGNGNYPPQAIGEYSFLLAAMNASDDVRGIAHAAMLKSVQVGVLSRV